MTTGEEAELYCLCRQAHNDRFMIMCDVCNEWYHGSCVEVSETEANRLENWLCQSCTERSALLNQEAQEIQYHNAELLKTNHQLMQKLVEKEREKQNLLKLVNDLMGRHIETLDIQLNDLMSQKNCLVSQATEDRPILDAKELPQGSHIETLDIQLYDLMSQKNHLISQAEEDRPVLVENRPALVENRPVLVEKNLLQGKKTQRLSLAYLKMKPNCKH